jgi:hypothetical protein
VSLVIEAGVSMRGAVRAMELFGEQLGLDWQVPHWTTLRNWIQRQGLAALTRSLPVAEDWVFFIDFSIQIGTRKCLVIMGLRLQDQPPEGTYLHKRDLSLIDLCVLQSATKEQVALRLEQAAQRVGTPQAIVDDHGADVSGGVALFQQYHPETREFYDLKHKAACLLKKLLTGDPQWTAFQHHLGQAKFATQQTPLAHVAPPSQRSKARFMNLERLITWGEKMLGWMDGTRRPKRPIHLSRIREKFAWLQAFREPLRQWSAWLAAVDTTMELVRRHGLSPALPARLQNALAPHIAAEPIRSQLLEFVTSQVAMLRPGERMPGTTEVVESCFAHLKHLEQTQANSGFTGLVLGLGSMLDALTHDSILASMRDIPSARVLSWVRAALGETVQSLRRFFFQNAPDAQQKPDTQYSH